MNRSCSKRAHPFEKNTSLRYAHTLHHHVVGFGVFGQNAILVLNNLCGSMLPACTHSNVKPNTRSCDEHSPQTITTTNGRERYLSSTTLRFSCQRIARQTRQRDYLCQQVKPEWWTLMWAVWSHQRQTMITTKKATQTLRASFSSFIRIRVYVIYYTCTLYMHICTYSRPPKITHRGVVARRRHIFPRTDSRGWKRSAQTRGQPRLNGCTTYEWG